MLNIDDWRVMYEAQEQDMAKLRLSLHDLEKRHEEAKLSLEVALEKIVEMAFKNREQGGYEAEKLQSDRNAAIARAAGLRKALELLLWACVDDGELTVPMRCFVHEATAALDPPGPSLAEIKAEALEEVANFSTHTITLYDERGWCYTKPVVLVEAILAEAARLRGGVK
jgi:hypothetical protein